MRIAKDVSGHLRTQFPSQHFMADDVVTITPGIGLYREYAIAIQKEAGDSNGGNV